MKKWRKNNLEGHVILNPPAKEFCVISTPVWLQVQDGKWSLDPLAVDFYNEIPSLREVGWLYCSKVPEGSYPGLLREACSNILLLRHTLGDKNCVTAFILPVWEGASCGKNTGSWADLPGPKFCFFVTLGKWGHTSVSPSIKWGQ